MYNRVESFSVGPMAIHTRDVKENLKSYLSGSKIGKKSESTRSYERAYVSGRGSYTWSNSSVKEKVGLSAGGGGGGGLIGGEIRYSLLT